MVDFKRGSEMEQIRAISEIIISWLHRGVSTLKPVRLVTEGLT